MNWLPPYLKWLLIIVLWCTQRVVAPCQPNSAINCTQLNIYTDSLDRLLLAYQPIEVIQIADSLLQQHGQLNCPAIIKMQANKGSAYELLYNFEAAIAIYNKILLIAARQRFVKEEAATRLSTARVYEAISRPELCKQYLAEAKQIIDQHQLNALSSRYYIRAASYQRIYGDKEIAKEYAQRGVNLGIEYGVVRSVADGNLLLGLLTEDFAASVEYSQRAADQFFKLGDYIGGIFQEMNVAKRYLQRGDYPQVLTIVEKAKAITEEVNYNDKVYFLLKAKIAGLEAEVYEKTKDKDLQITALKAFNNYSELYGDVVNQEKINQLVLDNTLKEEKEKVATAEQQSRFLLLSLFLLSAIIIILSRLYILNRTKSKKIQEQTLTITEQYEELSKLYNYQSTLLSEVHHRIKNNLQLIISLLTLQKAKLTNTLDAEMLNMLCYRINSIAVIHEQLYRTKEFDTVDVALYVKDILANYRTLTSEREISIDHQVDGIQLNLETITPLGLIWSELISNSIKYNPSSKGLKIHFLLTHKEGQYTMHYYDNGVGYPNGQFLANQSGMGFMIVQSLSRQLSAQTNIYNSNGAHFTMSFKEKVLSAL